MTKITIDEAAEMIATLDREAHSRGERQPNIPDILRLLPRLGYELDTPDLCAAFRRAAELQFAEADALEAEATG